MPTPRRLLSMGSMMPASAALTMCSPEPGGRTGVARHEVKHRRATGTRPGIPDGRQARGQTSQKSDTRPGIPDGRQARGQTSQKSDTGRAANASLRQVSERRCEEEGKGPVQAARSRVVPRLPACVRRHEEEEWGSSPPTSRAGVSLSGVKRGSLAPAAYTLDLHSTRRRAGSARAPTSAPAGMGQHWHALPPARSPGALSQARTRAFQTTLPLPGPGLSALFPKRRRGRRRTGGR